MDLATNDAIWRSNTYFFDACLGWGGLCIEASEVHYDRIRRERSCTLVPACVSNATNVSLTFSGGVGWRGGSSRLSAKPADPQHPYVRKIGGYGAEALTISSRAPQQSMWTFCLWTCSG